MLLVLSVFGAGVAARDVLLAALGVDGTGAMMDFATLHEAGSALWRGDDPYALYPFSSVMTLGGRTWGNPNLNPPTAHPLLLVMAAGPRGVMQWVWLVVEAVAMLAAFRLALGGRETPGPWIVAMIALSPPVCSGLFLANIYGLLTLLATLAWHWTVRGRPILAGVALGTLLMVRPAFGLWAVLLLMTPAWKASVTAAVTGLVGVASSTIAFGISSWVRWWEVVRDWPARFSAPDNVSVFGVLANAGMVPSPGLMWSTAAVVAVGGTVWFLAGGRTAERAAAAGLWVGFVGAPLAWVRYLPFGLYGYMGRPLPKVAFAGLAILLVPLQVALLAADLEGSVLEPLRYVPALGALLFVTGGLLVGRLEG